MPILKCPLGTKCTLGPDGSIWETEDVAKDLSITLLETHMKYAHPETVGGSQQSGGASGAGPPAQQSPGDHLNVNKGNQGGNFVNSVLYISYIESV